MNANNPQAGATRPPGAPKGQQPVPSHLPPAHPVPSHLVPAVEPAAGPTTWRESYDEVLQGLITGSRRHLVLVGRSMTSARAAAEDAHRAARVLADRAGFDVTAALPAEDRLIELMRTSGHHFAGESRRHRFLLIDLRGADVVLCLSVANPASGGTAHADMLAQHLKLASPRPAGVFATRTDRYSRTPHGLNRLYAELDHLYRSIGAWAGDGSVGPWNLGEPAMAPMLNVLVGTADLERRFTAARRAAARKRAGRSASTTPEAPGTAGEVN